MENTREHTRVTSEMFWVGLELLADPLLDEGQEVLVIGHAAAHVHLLPCPLGCWACTERERESDIYT